MAESNTITIAVTPAVSGLSLTRGMQVAGKQGVQQTTTVVGPQVER